MKNIGDIFTFKSALLYRLFFQRLCGGHISMQCAVAAQCKQGSSFSITKSNIGDEKIPHLRVFRNAATDSWVSDQDQEIRVEL